MLSCVYHNNYIASCILCFQSCFQHFCRHCCIIKWLIVCCLFVHGWLLALCHWREEERGTHHVIRPWEPTRTSVCCFVDFDALVKQRVCALSLASFPGLSLFCWFAFRIIHRSRSHSSAFMYYTEHKLKNKNWGGLGMRLHYKKYSQHIGLTNYTMTDCQSGLSAQSQTCVNVIFFFSLVKKLTLPWLDPTLPHSTTLYPDSTSLYHTLPWLNPTLPHSTLARPVTKNHCLFVIH